MSSGLGREYLTAFTVYLTEDLKAEIDLNPTVPVDVEITRSASPHDFDVAALWIQKYRQHVN